MVLQQVLLSHWYFAIYNYTYRAWTLISTLELSDSYLYHPLEGSNVSQFVMIHNTESLLKYARMLLSMRRVMDKSDDALKKDE